MPRPGLASRAPICPVRCFWLAVFCLFGLTLHPLRAGPSSPNENAVKAAFLYNFSRFIEWPERSFRLANEPFVIGVLGADDFNPAPAGPNDGGSYHGHPIRVEHYHTVRDIRRCHMLFVSDNGSAQFSAVVGAVAGRNILTVGESEGFLDRGGMIALISEQDRVRLRINSTALRRSKLNVSSKLLQVAEIHS